MTCKSPTDETLSSLALLVGRKRYTDTNPPTVVDGKYSPSLMEMRFVPAHSHWLKSVGGIVNFFSRDILNFLGQGGVNNGAFPKLHLCFLRTNCLAFNLAAHKRSGLQFLRTNCLASYQTRDSESGGRFRSNTTSPKKATPAPPDHGRQDIHIVAVT